MMNILKRVLKRPPSKTATLSAKPAAEAAQAVQEGRAETAPLPPRALNNYVVVVLDSCRYDTLMAAAPRTLSQLGEIERRYSYASWTAPSHYNLLMGLMPHTSPTGILAAAVYRRDYERYAER